VISRLVVIVAVAAAFGQAGCSKDKGSGAPAAAPPGWTLEGVKQQPVGATFESCDALVDEVANNRLTKEFSFKKGFFMVSGRVAKAASGPPDMIEMLLSDVGYDMRVEGRMVYMPKLVRIVLLQSPEVARAAQPLTPGAPIKVKCKIYEGSEYNPKGGAFNEQVNAENCIIL
jgi:hypothetical protein